VAISAEDQAMYDFYNANDAARAAETVVTRETWVDSGEPESSYTYSSDDSNYAPPAVGGGFGAPAVYGAGGAVTTNTPVVARPGDVVPISYPAPAVTNPVAAALGGFDTKTMMPILLFAGLAVLGIGMLKG
jgi:hypothetical protein